MPHNIQKLPNNCCIQRNKYRYICIIQLLCSIMQQRCGNQVAVTAYCSNWNQSEKHTLTLYQCWINWLFLLFFKSKLCNVKLKNISLLKPNRNCFTRAIYEGVLTRMRCNVKISHCELDNKHKLYTMGWCSTGGQTKYNYPGQ